MIASVSRAAPVSLNFAHPLSVDAPFPARSQQGVVGSQRWYCGPGQELEAAGQFLDLKRGSFLIVELLQFAEQPASRGRVRQTGPPGRALVRRQRFVGDQRQHRFEHRQLRIAHPGAGCSGLRRGVGELAIDGRQRMIRRQPPRIVPADSRWPGERDASGFINVPITLQFTCGRLRACAAYYAARRHSHEPRQQLLRA